MRKEEMERAIDLLYQYGQKVGVDKFRYDEEKQYFERRKV